MKLSKIFSALVPSDKKFFPLFDQASANIEKGAEALVALLTSTESSKKEEYTKEIKQLEHIGDNITHDIFHELNKSFITPFDREDIQCLASKLDDILDFINGAATKIDIYKPRHITPEMVKIAQLILESSAEIKTAMHALHNLKHPHKIMEACIKLNSIENQADDIYHHSLGDLFENEPNAVELIKKKEIILNLERAIDTCEDVSDVLRGIVIKTA